MGMIIFLGVLFIIEGLITFGSIFSWTKENNYRGVIFTIVGLLVMTGTFMGGQHFENKLYLEKAQYEENRVLETVSAKIARLDMVKPNTNSTSSKIQLLMTLEDGTISEINNKLFAQAKEGKRIYWERCVENCKHYEYNNSNRNYYLKDE
jgi:hypothetical protein